MKQTPVSIFFLAAFLVVFPVIDGFAAPLTSQLLVGTSSWMGSLVAALIILNLVWVCRNKHG